MIEDTLIKTHLIITDIHEEFEIKWCGKIIDTNPLLKNGKPIFILISSTSRVELNTSNIKQLEKCAKSITCPRGREATTIDKTHIYIKEQTGKETLIGIVVHKHIKTFAPMYDKVGYIK